MSNICIEKSNKWFEICQDISNEVKSISGGCNHYYRVLFSKEIESFAQNLKDQDKQSLMTCSKSFINA